MNWTTELIELFKNDILVKRESRINQILGDEPLIFPERIPFYLGDIGLRNNNIVIDLTTEEKIQLIELKEIPNTIFKYLNWNPYLFQSQLFDSLFKERFLLIRKGRQLGVTTILIDFLIHQCLLNIGSQNLVVCTSNKSIENIYNKLISDLRMIPLAFQVGISKKEEFSILWENGSTIKFRTEKNLTLNQNYDNIILSDSSYFENLSFLLNRVVPTMSSLKNGRIIIDGNITYKKSFFNDLCYGNKFPFKETIINSMNVPTRDSLWEKNKISIFGIEKYLSEFMCLIPETEEWNREFNLYQLLK
jgi:hypothetical protein